ncbi:MAG: NADPH-dependent FMN reductase [bacterium]
MSNAIQIVAIPGSVRPGNFTAKALAIAVDEFTKQSADIQVIDPSLINLPFPGTNGSTDDADALKEAVKNATGVVLSTPEYHGSYSSVIKLVVENLGFPSVLSGKPVALLGVAAGAIGAVKALEHLRSVCSHVGAIVLPGPVSIAGVQHFFDAHGHCTDEKVEQRIRGLATNLLDYIKQNICPRLALEQMVRKDD